MARFNNGKGGGKRPNSPSSEGPIRISEPRCAVCNAAHRSTWDKHLAEGYSISEICRMAEAMGEKFSRKSLTNHRDKHLTLKEAAIRRMIEDQAAAFIHDIEEHKGFMLTRRALLTTMMQEGYEAILKQKVKVDPQTLLQVAALLERMDAEEHAVAIDEMMVEMQAFMEAVKMLVEDDMWDRIVDQYESNLAISKQPPRLEQLVGPPIEDVEVLEDDEPEEES